MAQRVLRQVAHGLRQQVGVASDHGRHGFHRDVRTAVRPLVDDLCRRQLLAGVHAHVERRVIRIGEAPFGGLELEGRDAQVHIDEVRAHARGNQLGQGIGEVRSHEPGFTFELVRELLEPLLRGGIAIDADE